MVLIFDVQAERLKHDLNNILSRSWIYMRSLVRTRAKHTNHPISAFLQPIKVLQKHIPYLVHLDQRLHSVAHREIQGYRKTHYISPQKFSPCSTHYNLCKFRTHVHLTVHAGLSSAAVSSARRQQHRDAHRTSSCKQDFFPDSLGQQKIYMAD